jgi:hypothetical protein
VVSQPRIAVAALRFFSLSGPVQIAIRRESRTGREPTFFRDSATGDDAPGFFLGVACVFKTNQGLIYEGIDDDAVRETLTDFVHRLNVAMNDSSAADWSEAAVFQDRLWHALRKDAAKAIRDLGLDPVAEVPRFDIAALINPDEFRTSDEVRRILGDDPETEHSR